MAERMFKVLMFMVGISFLLPAPGCRKDCKSYDILLTEQQKKQIPFEGREKIIFKHDTNELVLNGTGRHDTIEKNLVSGYSCDYYNKESVSLTFEGENISLNLYMYARDKFHIKVVDFSQGLSMHASMLTAQSTGELSEYEELIDSLTVNNSLYLNVYKDTVGVTYSFNTRDSMIYATYIYYSTDFGVVKIDFSDGSAWELENIEW